MVVNQHVRNLFSPAKTYVLATSPNSKQVSLSDKKKFMLDSLYGFAYY